MDTIIQNPSRRFLSHDLMFAVFVVVDDAATADDDDAPLLREVEKQSDNRKWRKLQKGKINK